MIRPSDKNNGFELHTARMPIPNRQGIFVIPIGLINRFSFYSLWEVIQKKLPGYSIRKGLPMILDNNSKEFFVNSVDLTPNIILPLSVLAVRSRHRYNPGSGSGFPGCVLPEGRRALDAHGAFGKGCRRADHLHLPVLGVLHLLHNPRCWTWGSLKTRSKVLMGPQGIPAWSKRGIHSSTVFLASVPVDDFHQGGAVLDPCRVVGKPGVFLQSPQFQEGRRRTSTSFR